MDATTYTWNEDIEKIQLGEDVVPTTPNRPLQRLYENTLFNKETWEIWLSDPFLDNSLTLNKGALLKKIDTNDELHVIIDDEALVKRADYNDLAELMPKSGEAEPGDVLIWEDGGVRPSCEEGDKRVIGIYSDTFGMYLGGEEKLNKKENFEKYIPVGLTGRVKVNAIGPIKTHDLLETSKKKGHVQSSKDCAPGSIVGKALEDLSKGEKKRIWALILNR